MERKKLDTIMHQVKKDAMQIGSWSSSPMVSDQRLADLAAKGGASVQVSSATFSNMTPQQMVDATQQLVQAGKLTVHQSGQMAIMDGEALVSVNGGKFSAGSSNMYQIIDESITEQKANGDQLSAKADIASYQSLQSILQNYDDFHQQGVSQVA